ncbi:DUF2867 domain-containing protein [Streptomyces sp. NPDC001219]
MRLPNSAHTARPWLIHALASDFRLADVWALPTPGGPDDLPRLVRQMTSGDGRFSGATRGLFALRWKLGRLLGWDRGQMAVLVKPNGRFGAAYMAVIRPFRHLLVDPALMRLIGRAWQNRADNVPAG